MLAGRCVEGKERCLRWSALRPGTAAISESTEPRSRYRQHLSASRPRLGISWSIVAGSALYGSAGQGFRAPAVIKLACADPEQPCPLPFALGDGPADVVATTYEGGRALGSTCDTLDISVYHTRVSDDIFLFPDAAPDGSTIDGYFANVSRTRREGLELETRHVIAAGHSVRLAYALTRATFQSSMLAFSAREHAGELHDVSPGDRLPLVPEGVSMIVRNLFDRRYASFGTFNVNQAPR